jgi:hypothetical protein
MSDAGLGYASLAARAAYVKAGHDVGGIVEIALISGRAAKKMIEFRPRKSVQALEHDNQPC